MTSTKVVMRMAAKINRYMGTSTTTEKPGPPGVPRTDWEYLTNVAAKAQGESWLHIINSQKHTPG